MTKELKEYKEPVQNGFVFASKEEEERFEREVMPTVIEQNKRIATNMEMLRKKYPQCFKR